MPYKPKAYLHFHDLISCNIHEFRIILEFYRNEIKWLNELHKCLSVNMFIKKISSKNLNTYLDGTNSNMHRVKLRNVSGKALIRQMKLSLFPFYSMIAFAFTILSVVVYMVH